MLPKHRGGSCRSYLLSLTQSQYTGTGPTRPSADPVTPGAWQGSNWSINFFFFFLSHCYDSTSAKDPWRNCLFVGCLTSQQHASVSHGRICSDNFTCCDTEVEVADPTIYLTQSQYTDTGPTSPYNASAWQGSHWSANF